MMAAPYRLQVLLPDDLREAIREIAHQQRLSQQKLIVQWLTEKAQEHSAGQHLAAPEPDDR